jgi:lipoic acid synthetase
MITKSGFMVGLGEQWEEIVQLLFTLRNAGVEIVTIGQYLSPTRKHHPVIRYYTPEEFFLLQRIGEKMGFSSVVAGPLVRSSYHAHSAFLSIQSAVENPSPNKESGK